MKRNTRRRSEKASKRYANKRNKAHTTSNATKVGVVSKSSRGLAFIDYGAGSDVFVSRQFCHAILDGDTGEFKIVESGRRPEAQVLRVISRLQHELVGRVRDTEQGRVILTQRGEWFRLKGQQRTVDHGDWVLAHISTRSGGTAEAFAQVTEPLGAELLPAHDVLLATAQFGLHADFPNDVLTQSQTLPSLAIKEALPQKHRKDQRAMAYVTIDGEDAKDFDDAVCVTRNSRQSGKYTLYVAIADVSFFVKSGSAIDREARARSTSVYFPGYCIPMLPELLSNDLCSLRPGVERLAITAEIHFDSDGKEISAQFYPSLIQTAARLTYRQVHSWLQNDRLATQDFTTEVIDTIDSAYALYKLLRKQRRDRDVLDFDLGECQITVDRLGRPTSLGRAPRYESHMLIEEFMIAANRAVARALRKAAVPSLYRVHEPPTADSVETLNEILYQLGISARIEEITPRAFARILERVIEHPAAPAVNQALLRSQQQAHYEPSPRGHFGLNLADYTHFTSPIRRYPDLVVHRALKQLMLGSKEVNSASDGLYEELGKQTSSLERRAMEAERFVVKRKQCWYMLGKLGQSYAGVVCGVVEGGAFVEIRELATDGFVPIEFLEGRFEYDRRSQSLRQRPGRAAIKLGDPMQVRVEKVSLDENRIWFSPELPTHRSPAPPHRRTKR